MDQKSNTETAQSKMKFICLHGFTASKEFMNLQLEPWELAFGREIEFISLDGAFEIPNDREWIPNNVKVQ